MFEEVCEELIELETSCIRGEDDRLLENAVGLEIRPLGRNAPTVYTQNCLCHVAAYTEKTKAQGTSPKTEGRQERKKEERSGMRWLGQRET